MKIIHLLPLFLLLFNTIVNASNNNSLYYKSKTTREIRTACLKENLDTSAIVVKLRDSLWTEYIRVPKGIPLVKVSLRFWNMFKQRENIDIIESYKKHKKRIIISFVDEKKHKRKLILAYSGILKRFKLAIILKGIETAEPELVENFISLSSDFSYMVDIDFIKQAHSVINDNGELIAITPMEHPSNKGRSTILLQTPKSAIIKELNMSKCNTYNVKGITNPLSSIILSDYRVMSVILKEIKKRNVYFVEIKPTKKSVGYKLAKEINAPYLLCKNELRTDDSELAINGLNRLFVIANKTGKAVATANISYNTLLLIQNNIKNMEDNGIQFSTVSELVSF